jgi:hypothetical protein
MLNIASFTGPTDTLLVLSQNIISGLTSGEFSKVQKDLDEFRLIRSLYSDLFQQNIHAIKSHHDQQTPEIQKLLSSIAEVLQNINAIETWQRIAREELAKLSVEQLKENAEFVIEVCLPGSWNSANDIVLVPSELADAIVDKLWARGQQRIIVLGEYQNPNTQSVQSEAEAESVVNKWDFSKNAQICSIFTGLKDNNGEVVKCIYELVRISNMGTNTLTKFSRMWVDNHIQNIPEIARSRPIKDLQEIIKNQPVVIISPGPSLEKNIELLKDLKDSHTLIAPVQTAQALKKHEIVPDFFIVVDPTDYSNVLNDFPIEECQGLVIMEACHPNFMKLPFREKFIISSTMLGHTTKKYLKEEVETSSGSSVSTHAAIMSAELGVARIVLVGQDLAVGERHYYHRSGFDNVRGPTTTPPDYDSAPVPMIEVDGWSGGKVRTPTDYYVYLKELELLASRFSDQINLFNCTEGGAYINGFSHLSLSDYISTIEITNEPSPLLPRRSNIIESARTGYRELIQNETLLLRQTVALCEHNIALAEAISNNTDQKLIEFESNEKQIEINIKEMIWLPNAIMSTSAITIRRISLAKTLADNLALTREHLTLIRDEGSKLLETLSRLKT